MTLSEYATAEALPAHFGVTILLLPFLEAVRNALKQWSGPVPQGLCFSLQVSREPGLVSATRFRSSDVFSVGNTGTKSSSSLSLPTNILFSVSQHKIAAPVGNLFHTFNIVLFLKKGSLNQVLTAWINRTSLCPLTTFLDISGLVKLMC